MKVTDDDTLQVALVNLGLLVALPVVAFLGFWMMPSILYAGFGILMVPGYMHALDTAWCKFSGKKARLTKLLVIVHAITSIAFFLQGAKLFD